ncbi:nucleotidyltransferase family protein [Luteibaculum oceani]|uniref:Nucleotidyltransferase family protein n=1 Tax=Luteibaculum oceani TaxID=1294296 RepID=A0A5C6V532_9FLAO|nr:nucleotidyltransferase family protein [Luteibaculum oceani]TXC78695.1 nucleotidyltransferase family protein [Luteibaculum oceani]
MKSLEEIKSQLAQLKTELSKKYPIASMAIFGSVARSEATENSDIDILVEFDGKIGSRFISLANELESSLKNRVDLVSRKGIKQKYFERIKSDLVYV